MIFTGHNNENHKRQFFAHDINVPTKIKYMTDKQKIEKLKHAFEETIWMAIRYAHSEKDCFLVENAIKAYKVLFPDFKMKQDFVVMKDDKHLLSKSIIWDI